MIQGTFHTVMAFLPGGLGQHPISKHITTAAVKPANVHISWEGKKTIKSLMSVNVRLAAQSFGTKQNNAKVKERQSWTNAYFKIAEP